MKLTLSDRRLLAQRWTPILSWEVEMEWSRGREICSTRGVARTLTFLLGAMSILACSPELPAPRVAECSDPGVASVVAEYFELVSGPAGERDWASFRALFLARARLHALGVDADGSNQLYPQSPAEYADHIGEYVREQGFHHQPLRHSIDCSGRLARALVSFESRNSQDGPLIDSGHIAFHLLHDGESWRIAHVMWQSQPTP